LLEQNPSLRREVAARAQRAYPSARTRAVIETELPEASYPKENPYSSQQLLDPKFFP
jgi:hypothetical protein